MKHIFKLFLCTFIILSIIILNPTVLSYYSPSNIPVQQNIENTSNTNNISTIIGSGINVTYYNQKDDRWGNKIYGYDNTISIYGCGPTVLSMLISSLTEKKIMPDEMAQWAYDNGYFCKNSGSYHSIISEAPTKWGLNVTPIYDYSKNNIINLLSNGNLIVVLMGKGHFTENGHFIILCGVSLEGNIIVADPASFDNSQKEWSPDIIINEAKYQCGNNGPMWLISNPTIK